MRYVTPEPNNPHRRANICEVEGCSRFTRERKRYCEDHVDRHPYVVGLLEAMAQRELDDERAGLSGDLRRRRLNLNGITPQDMLTHLRVYGPRTVERLARELHRSIQVIEGYARALRRAGLVAIARTKRGADVVQIKSRSKESA